MSESEQEQRDRRILGEAVRQVRERERLSIDEVSAASGVPSRRIAAIEAGRLDPRFELLLTLAQAMGVRLSAFINRGEELEAEEGGAQD